jgi:uncharacterized caspase-like protein
VSDARDVELASRPERTRDAAGRNAIAVIGIDRYRHWGRLKNAERDARGAAALFRRLGFEEVVPPLLNEQATGGAIRALVTDQLRMLGPEDSLVLFYAGHGGTRKHDLGGQEVETGYLIPADARAAPDEVATWIELESWLRAVSLLPSRHILVILDACHSGIALDPIIKWRDSGSWQDTPLSTLRARRSRRIITSALGDQVAMDGGPVHGHSLFTGCLIEALTGGIPRGGRPAITGSELAVHVQQRVSSYPRSRQTPDFGTFDFDDRGELVLPVLLEQPELRVTDASSTQAVGGAPTPKPSSTRRKQALIAGIVAVAGVAAVVIGAVATRGDTPERGGVPPVAAAAPFDASPPPPEPDALANRWIRREPPATPYRLGVADRAPSGHVGFRASRGIVTPSRPYAIQEHEVTWSELDPWLAANGLRIDAPPWAADVAVRRRLPATGVTWSMASAYCRSLGGALPTEEQWEYAARGPERRPSPWGAEPLDLSMTHAFGGPAAAPSPVMESLQDRTPHSPPIYDLAGNVQEWTLGLWREDLPGKDESDVQAGTTTSRAIRGLPLAQPPPSTLQPESAAYRERLCATGPCVERTRKLLARVGFRCAKPLDQ